MNWKTILTAAALLLSLGAVRAADTLSLAGEWRFSLDRLDVGESEQWFTRPLPERVRLPGDLTEQGIGDPPTQDTPWIGGIRNPQWSAEPALAPYARPETFKFPYWLTPERYYAGAAWFQRDIDVAPDWAGKRIVLILERPHWETRVWVDGKSFGSNNALATPHEYDLGPLLPGRHVLAIRVDNRMIIDVGSNSHSVSDHTQGNWNGIVGRIELRATPLVWIDDLQAYPDIHAKTVRVRGRLGNANGNDVTAKVVLSVSTAGSGGTALTSTTVAVRCTTKGGTLEAELKAPADIALWDEFNPSRYQLSATVGEAAERDVRSITFGFRELTVQGTQFVLNGRKIYLRGTLECAIFPRTGHPPTDVESWRHVIRAAKAHGLNHIRFHSWCPPEAAFIAADELGLYLHVECSSWANQTSSLGDGKPVDAWLYAEADRILEYYGNHPSFVFLLYGNEPGGKNHRAYLSQWVDHYRKQDSRRLYSSGAGWPLLDENDFHVVPDPRIQRWGEGLKSRINAKPPETITDYRDYIGARKVPVISHEIGQWCVYPNFDEIPKYTGYLKPRNFEIFRDTLNAHHLGDQARAFLIASGKLQTLCYKEEIESALRTPGMGGFQLLDLHDFPGQGTALVGVLDPFWESKGYVTPAEYSRFCNATVPLARLAKRVFTTDETIEARMEVAHFGARPMESAVLAWKLVNDEGRVVARGELPARTLPVDNGISVGDVRVDGKSLPAPARYKLVAGIVHTTCENDWDIWVYPPHTDVAVPSGISAVDELTDDAVTTLKRGGKVLWMIPPRRVAPDRQLGKIALGFSSIFWNTAWTGRQAPHTLGILCEPKHALFSDFPTDFHSNWQWWHLVSQAGAMIMDEMPPALRPTVQVIDDWTTNRKLGLVFEAKVGTGKLVVCSIDLEHGLDGDPVRRQFRHSLLRYMSGYRFNPAVGISVEQARGLIGPPSPFQKLGIVSVEADSQQDDMGAENAMDGDSATLWHTAWGRAATDFPHHLRIECKAPRTIRGFTALPRQDGNRNGTIWTYAFHASDDGKSWGEPVARGKFEETKALKTVVFERPVRGRFFKLVALTGPTIHAALAEFSLLEAKAAQTAEAIGSPVVEGNFGAGTRLATERNKISFLHDERR